MAVNYHEKYASAIAKAFTLSSLVKGVFKAKLDFTGAKTVKVTKLVTTPLNDYKRSGSNRYGEPQDVSDIVMEYTMTQDKSFSGSVDKGDALDQNIENKAGQWLKAEMDEEVAPWADMYAFSKMTENGTVLALDAAPTESTILSVFTRARTHFTNKKVPKKGRFVWVCATDYGYLLNIPQFATIEKLGIDALCNGHVGVIMGFNVIEAPDDYFPEGVREIFAHEKAGTMPYKIHETKIHKDPPGISGALIEGRQYMDFFVFEEKKDAVLVAKTA